MNKEKVEKLIKWIEEEPRRYNQREYAVKAGQSLGLVEAQEPPCGTVACLAGGACLMEGYELAFDKLCFAANVYNQNNPEVKATIFETARCILELSNSQADMLFGLFADRWARKFYQEYKFSKSVEGRAKAAIGELRHLLETGKVGDVAEE